jgi:serine protease Do
VHEAIATSARQSRRRFVAAAAALAVLGAGAVWAAARLGVFEGTEGHFRRLADAYQGRVVLVEVGVSHDGRYARLGNGTGFFAGPDGLIVTYSTDHKTLELVVAAPDTLMAAVGIECRDIFGGPPFTYAWQQHAMDNHDLVVLKASRAREPIPMAASEPETDDDVMVLGFPTGTVPLETNKAEPIRRLGNVLRTRETIQIDAVVLGGNSGGPLIDRNGDVVGVTTRGTAESLNMAIKVEHVRRLLERARQGS